MVKQDRQMEVYRYKQYRKKRVRLYLLIGLNIAMVVIMLMMGYLSVKRIDDSNIHEYNTVHEVVENEYGSTYINKLKNVPTIKYESYYGELRSNYIQGVQDGSSTGELNKRALELVIFVEYVQEDAETTAEEYNLTKASGKFYNRNKEYIEEHGEVMQQLVSLIGEHRDGDIQEDVIVTHITDLDARMDMYIDYLMSLKRAK